MDFHLWKPLWLLPLPKFNRQEKEIKTSLVAQQLRIHLPKQGKQVQPCSKKTRVMGRRAEHWQLVLPLQELPSSTRSSLARFTAAFGHNLQSRTGQCRIQMSCFNWVTQEGLLYLQNSCKDYLRSLSHLYQKFKIYNPSPFKKELNRVIQFACCVIVLNFKLNWNFNLI